MNYNKKIWYKGSVAYNKLLKKQDYVCGMCKRDTKLLIHHNHMTGKVKGLLCSGCNSEIHKLKYNYAGMNEDSLKLSASMIYSGYKIKWYSSKTQINKVCEEIDCGWWKYIDNFRLKY